MTRFVGLNGVWINPDLVTSVQTSTSGQTAVCFGAIALEVDLPLGEVIDLLEDDEDES